MNITPRHRQEWEQSGVSADIIDRNVWTIDDPSEVDKLLNRNTKRRWKHSDDLVPGWAVAGIDPVSGERSYRGAQFKPDSPPLDPKSNKPRKYFSPAYLGTSPLFLETSDPEYWPKLSSDLTAPVILTEGAKKAGAVISAGHHCISIPGVTTGGKLGRLKPELQAVCRYGRRVYLAFDRDILQKRQVQIALHNLGRMLAANGAMVYVLVWANNHKGIDDYIAAGGDVGPLIESAETLEEWHELVESAPELSEIEKCRLAQRYEWVADKLKGRIRFNALKGVIELDGTPADMDQLRLYLALRHNIDIPDADCSQICLYLAKQSTFSPIAEYLKNCAEDYEPDPDLLDQLAETYLGATSRLHRSYLRKTLISAVARALTPGCKVDTVLILSGLQGVGKSSFWKILAGDFFDDSLGAVSDKDERLKLHQSWMVEWAELEAVFKRKDISAVKAFITTQVDQIRPPYGRTVQEFSRPSIIVGTTNFDEFLADPTGNRRFWVLPIRAPMIPLELLGQERDRIWAAATHAFLAGEQWTLPQDLRQEAQADSQEYSFSDPWEDAIFEYLEGRSKVTASEVLANAIHLDIDRQDRASQMRVTNLLKSNKWTTSREVVHGRRVRVWFSPNFNNEVVQVVHKEGEAHENQCGQPPGQPMGQPPGQPPENAKKMEPPKGVDNLDNLDNQNSKTRRNKKNSQLLTAAPPFEVGQRVSVRSGQFAGKPCAVLAVWQTSPPPGDTDAAWTVEIRAESWVFSREYMAEELIAI